MAQQNSEYSISSHTFTFIFDYPTIWKLKVTILNFCLLVLIQYDLSQRVYGIVAVYL